jgi:hypothetical protein
MHMSPVRKCAPKAETKATAPKKAAKSESPKKAAPAAKKVVAKPVPAKVVAPAAKKAAPAKAKAPIVAKPAAKKAAAAAPKAAAKKTAAPVVKAKAKSRLRKVPFEKFAPASGSVAVAGDFNGWDPTAFLLARDAEGIWRGEISIAPGNYQYRLVFDGNWEHDPEHEVVEGPHGLNNLLIVT